MQLREAKIGGAILMMMGGALIFFLAPNQVGILSLFAAAITISVWGLVWLIGEIVGNGTSRSQNGPNAYFRDANIGWPVLIGTIGTLLLTALPNHLPEWSGIEKLSSVPLHTIGWVGLAGGLLWLAFEIFANGVRSNRRRRARGRDDDDQGQDGYPPVIIGA